MNPDQINGGFELFGGLILFANVYSAWQDKLVRGVNLYAVLYMTTWGFWNLYFYPCVNAPWSLAGSVIVVIANITWLSQILHYKSLEKKNGRAAN